MGSPFGVMRGDRRRKSNCKDSHISSFKHRTSRPNCHKHPNSGHEYCCTVRFMSGLLNDEAVVLYGDILRLTDAFGGRADRTIREAAGLGGSEFEVLLRLARHP